MNENTFSLRPGSCGGSAASRRFDRRMARGSEWFARFVKRKRRASRQSGNQPVSPGSASCASSSSYARAERFNTVPTDKSFSRSRPTQSSISIHIDLTFVRQLSKAQIGPPSPDEAENFSLLSSPRKTSAASRPKWFSLAQDTFVFGSSSTTSGFSA